MSDTPTPGGRIDARQIQYALANDLPIDFDGLVVTGDLTLCPNHYHRRLRLVNCTFEGRVNLAEGEFLRTVDLTSCTFARGADFSAAHFGGNLVLTNAQILGSFGPNGTNAELLTVDRNLIADGLRTEFSIDLRNARIGGHMLVRGSKIGGRLLMPGIKVGGIDLTAAHLGALDLRGAVIVGKVEFTCAPDGRGGWHRPAVAGDLTAHSAEVSDDIDLRGIEIGGELHMRGANIHGSLLCGPFREKKGDRTEAPRTLIGKGFRLRGVKVGGDVDLAEAIVVTKLSLANTTIGGGLYCSLVEVPEACPSLDSSDAASTRKHLKPELPAPAGAVRHDQRPRAIFYNVKVTSQAVFTGATLAGDLVLVHSDIRNGVYLGPSVEEGGRQTTVGGHVNLSAARIHGECDLNGVRVGGDVRLVKATVIGKLSCSSASYVLETGGKRTYLRPEVGGKLNLHNVEVSGNVDLSGCESEQNRPLLPGVGVTGALDMSGARVLGQLDLSGASVGKALDLSGAAVQGKLKCLHRDATPLRVGETFDLRGCHAGEVHLEFPTVEVAIVNLDGFQFDSLHVQDRKAGDLADHLCRFLEADPTFSQGSYARVEKWLRDQGRHDDADKVFLAMSKQRRKTMGPISRFGDQFLLFGYSMPAKFPLSLLFCLLLFSWLLFSSANAIQHKSPDDARNWGALDGLALAAQTHVPIISFAAPDKWKPAALSTGPITVGGQSLWLSYAGYGTLMALVSYAILPMLLARAAFVIRKQR